ncbi:hypothetical protein EFK50_15310 [Nocardioides marmoriginsengisoli]|uniref:Choice-of-anchor G family protein n=1 Tax=Nocardioides marmoriginsengisoli TaxID=661483 RepID=A0A3N0CI25_9ACTN|nr:hypothetical protein EFK50_15310 [Nocardioides marmoriginsengisoli]
MLRFGAIIGAAAVSALAVSPVFAAAPVSQADAQSLQLSLAGNSLVTQTKTASNDGTTETTNNASTLPDLVSLIPGNNAIKAGVAIQSAKANKDGTSYACAGLAGTGGGLVTVGTESCNLEGGPLTLDLGSLDLDLVNLLGGNGAISTALNGVLGSTLAPVLGGLQTVVSQLTGALASTPLNIGLSGGLSVIEASCVANPTKATGTVNLLDTSGDKSIPITLTLAGQKLTLLNLNVDVPAKPGGTDVLVNLNTVLDALKDALLTQIATMLQGQLAGITDGALKPLLDTVIGTIVAPLVNALEPLLVAVSDNLLKITINDVTPGDGGRSVKATALKVKVLGAAAPFLNGAGLVDATVGKVSCGPNRAIVDTPTPTPTPTEEPPGTPTVVDSGVSGADHTTRDVLMATTALVLLAGTAGLIGYRRMLLTK